MPRYTAYFDTETHRVLAAACRQLLFSFSPATTSEDGFRSTVIASLANNHVPLPLITTPANRTGAADVWVGETRIEIKYAHPARKKPLHIKELAADVAELAKNRCGFSLLGVTMASGEHADEKTEKQHVRNLIELPGLITERTPKCWYDSGTSTLVSGRAAGRWFAPGLLVPVVHFAGSRAMPSAIEIKKRKAGARGRSTYSYMAWRECTSIETRSLLMLTDEIILSCWAFGSPEIGRLVILFTRVPSNCLQLPKASAWSTLSIKRNDESNFDYGSCATTTITRERSYSAVSEELPVFKLY